jgi:hypothetical protein
MRREITQALSKSVIKCTDRIINGLMVDYEQVGALGDTALALLRNAFGWLRWTRPLKSHPQPQLDNRCDVSQTRHS